jgi:uncharacterized protein YjbI with pentapeptide repeats
VVQEQRPPDRSFIRELVPEWRPTRAQALRVTRTAVVVVFILLGVLLLLYIIGFLFGIKLLNLLKILAVPITVGAAVPLLNWLQKRRELDVENQRAQDEALQAYLDQMSQLLLDKDVPLRQSKKDDEVRNMARARTLTVLSRLDGERKVRVVQFLYELGLIGKPEPLVSLAEADLSGANLDNARLKEANLSRANLRGAHVRGTNLDNAHLRYTQFSFADLSPAPRYRPGIYYPGITPYTLWPTDLMKANLEGAEFGHADLRSAALENAVLRGARLGHADLRRAVLKNAVLTYANLRDADLTEANFEGANLSKAYLKDATVTTEQLEQASSLQGATMPNGQKYEEWLKDREGSREDGENTGRS